MSARLVPTALLAIALVVGSTTAPAATQSTAGITGTVVDSGSGAPIGGAYVAALRTSGLTFAKGAVAAADGGFTLADLAVGDYYLYAIDPGGGHAAGFHGGPTAVAVAGAGLTHADPALRGSRGRIVGVVSEDGSDGPVAGAWVAALSGATGRLEGGVVADASGAFVFDDLAPGDHFLVSVDPTGRHAPEFYDDSPGPGGSTPVTVSVGATSTVTASLAAMAAPDPTGSIAGRVTETGSAVPIRGAWVVALDAATLQVAGGARTDDSGEYSLGVEPGAYLVETVDPSGLHAPEWYDDQPFTGLSEAATVTVGPGTSAEASADLDPTTGSLDGTVTEDFSGDPVPGAWVLAIGPAGPIGTTVAANGSYTIDGLAPGSYRAAFVDPSGGRSLEYSGGSADFAGATAFDITTAGATPLSASLAPLVCSGAGAPAECLPAYPTPAPGSGWSKYTIASGAHSAAVTRGSQATNPLAGFTSVGARRYHFLFDSTARYVLTNPTQPEDQFDWNKLPGISDCGGLDLSQNGWMFGWRWRTDLAPRRLEVTAYANNNGTHLTPPAPMLVLTEQQVVASVPLWFDLSVSPDRQSYQFRVTGPGSRTATATLPRQCPATSPTGLKWASGFYFGGTSTAPNAITGWINER